MSFFPGSQAIGPDIDTGFYVSLGLASLILCLVLLVIRRRKMFGMLQSYLIVATIISALLKVMSDPNWSTLVVLSLAAFGWLGYRYSEENEQYM